MPSSIRARVSAAAKNNQRTSRPCPSLSQAHCRHRPQLYLVTSISCWSALIVCATPSRQQSFKVSSCPVLSTWTIGPGHGRMGEVTHWSHPSTRPQPLCAKARDNLSQHSQLLVWCCPKSDWQQCRQRRLLSFVCFQVTFFSPCTIGDRTHTTSQYSIIPFLEEHNRTARSD